VRELRYGAVCVNAWPALPYRLSECSWGAYPGRTDTDIQSGRGTVTRSCCAIQKRPSYMRHFTTGRGRLADRGFGNGDVFAHCPERAGIRGGVSRGGERRWGEHDRQPVADR